MKNMSALLLLLLFSLNVFAAEYGVFMIVEGKVYIQNPQATVEAKVNSKIQVGDTVISENNSRAKIVMSDRNVINITPNTKLKIEKYINTTEEKKVELDLIEGSVRSDVEHIYNEKDSYYEVRTPIAVVGVRGTQFVTSYDKNNDSAEVITIKGQVSFKRRAAKNSNSFLETVLVKKGERSRIREGRSPTRPFRIPDAEFNKINFISSFNKAHKAKSSAKKRTKSGVKRRPPIRR